MAKALIWATSRIGDNSWYVRAFDAGYREHKLADRLTITTNDSPTFANGVFH